MFFSSRKRYFIEKDFQTRFILRFVMTTTVWAASALALFVFIVRRRLEEFLYSPHVNVKTTAELLMPSAVQVTVVSLVLFLVLLAYAIRTLSRKLSGPLYSLKKDISRIASGDLVSGVALKDEDEFQDLAAALDRMRSRLRKRFVGLKEWQEETAGSLTELNRSVLKGNPSLEQVETLREAVAKLKEELNGFTY